MTHRIIYCCFVIVLAPVFVQCISVVGPRVLRPHSAYRVALAAGPHTYSLYVAVEGRRANGEEFTQGRDVQLQSGSSRLLDLEIGDPGPGTYSLTARSTSGPKFSSSAPLIYQARSFCVFIQTDKRIFQPGDTINFRVIALDKYLLPLSAAAEVSVLDAGGAAVRQWAAAALDRGLLAAEFTLDDEPALGEWTIQVELRGQTYSRRVLIADYVMPKFQMEMTMPQQVLFSEGRFTVNVSARHFNGLPVRGELTLSAYTVFFSGILQPVFSSPNRKVLSFDGNTEVTYDLKTDLELAEDAARPLVVEAVLEEKNTLIRQNITSRILLLRTPYRLKISAPEFFKPTLPYNVQIEVVDPSGQVIDENGEVSVERIWDDGAPANVTTVKLNNGAALYSYTPDIAHSNSTLNILIKYKDVTERVVNLRRSTGSRGQYLTLELLSKKITVGETMRARVHATEAVDLLHYAVLGRGDLLHAKTLELSPARRSVDLNVPIVTGMAPGCVLLVWYPRIDPSSNDLLAASLYAPVGNLIQHEVSVSVSGGVPRPGSGVEMKVNAASGAHIAIIGQDSKAIQAGLAADNGLGTGLSMQMIEREVESFSGLSHSIFKNEDHQPGLGRDLGGNTTADVFHNAGVVVLSDGVINRNSPEAMLSPQSVPETGTRAPLAGPYAFSRLPAPPSPRYYLTLTPQPTWMLANFSLGNDGTGAINRVTPVVSGNWTIGAFGIHPTLGLGMAAPRSVSTATALSVTADIPSTLQRGETLAAVVTLTSTLAVDTTVEVTFHNSEQYFDFEPLDNDVDSTKKVELFRRLRVTVPARGLNSTAFLVTAVRGGEAPVIIEANGNGVSDSLFRTINVKEGYEEELWSWSLLDARGGVARSNLTLRAPAGTRVWETSLRAAGDLLAPAVRAARAPPAPSAAAGDPAHALRPLAVACVLLNYLRNTDRDEGSISTEARAQVATGYQRLMAYRLRDGSFAPVIGNDAVGDVWMTAMSARWLSRAARYLSVSPAAAAAAARWLADAQATDGSWPAPAPLQRHNQLAQRTLPLTAHALLALLRIQGSERLYKNEINKATDYIAKSLSEDLDVYTLALSSAALAAVSHPFAARALQTLDLYSNVTDDMRWWERAAPAGERRSPWLAGARGAGGAAAWGLRALLAARRADAAVPVARYLLARGADRDPDVLEALAEFAETIKTPAKLRVSVMIPGSEEMRQFNIDDDNALIVQTQLVRNVRNASATTEGRGVAAVGLSARGATNVTGAWPRYTLDPRVDAVSTKHRLQLSICIGFVPQENETVSGFTLLTVQLPSGYVADINTLTELTAASHVSSARLALGGRRVLAWLRPLDARERCATLAAPRAQPVARQRPGYATLLDLYDSSHRARVFFQPVVAHACDVCRAWASCAGACGAAASQRADAAADRGPRARAHAAPAARAARAALLAVVVAVSFSLLRGECPSTL